MAATHDGRHARGAGRLVALPRRREIVYLLAGVPGALLGGSVALLAIVGGGLLGATALGTRTTPVVVALTRRTAGFERRRLSLVRPAPEVEYEPLTGPRSRALSTALLRSPATWRDLAWLLAVLPLGLGSAVAATAAWGTGAALLALPLWYRFLPGGHARLYESSGWKYGVVDSAQAALPWSAAGLVLLWLAGWATRLLVTGQGALAAALLRASRTTRLRARVLALAETRAATVEGRHLELRRIERDLHDGAQARLVALSADLGLAEESFDHDPGGARELVGRARDEAVHALRELRDLVRGIGPPILVDRGLAAALEAVAASSPLPVDIRVELPERPPPAVETAAYFVVCECLANAAKHSGADRVSVEIRHRSRRCEVVVRDDGGGGADSQGAGLRGLRERTAALDGAFDVHSPAGGPTTIRAELPCAW